jgi:hypothetical protein
LGNWGIEGLKDKIVPNLGIEGILSLLVQSTDFTDYKGGPESLNL